MKLKKGQSLAGLQAIIVPLIGVAIVLVIGFLIIAETQTQIESTSGIQCSSDASANGSIGCNASRQVQEAMSDVPQWLPIIIITLIGSLLLGLVAYFRAR